MNFDDLGSTSVDNYRSDPLPILSKGAAIVTL